MYFKRAYEIDLAGSTHISHQLHQQRTISPLEKWAAKVPYTFSQPVDNNYRMWFLLYRESCLRKRGVDLGQSDFSEQVLATLSVTTGSQLII
jgi:hypothetical protein